MSEKKTYFWDLETYDNVESTNALVRKAAREKAPEGLVVSALQQTGGHGRQGRVWSSPKGGLYASFLVRPQCPLVKSGSLSLVASLAVRNAIYRSTGLKATIKWPNDVMYEGKKLAGISLEAIGTDAIIIGIGINVFHPFSAPVASDKYQFGFLSELADGAFPDCAPMVSASGLAEEQRLGIVKVLIALLKELEADYLCWKTGGFSVFQDEYNEHLAIKGRNLFMESIDGKSMGSGTAIGVDSEGHLLLRDEMGVVKPILAGEVHFINNPLA